MRIDQLKNRDVWVTYQTYGFEVVWLTKPPWWFFPPTENWGQQITSNDLFLRVEVVCYRSYSLFIAVQAPGKANSWRLLRWGGRSFRANSKAALDSPTNFGWLSTKTVPLWHHISCRHFYTSCCMCLCCCAPTTLFWYDVSCLFMFVFSQKTVSVMVVDGIRDDPFMLEDTSVDGDWCIKHTLR